MKGKATELEPGDVLRYNRERHHCREGTAFVMESGRAVDTFWHTYGAGDSHILTADELATAEVKFNVNDYDELDQYESDTPAKWMTYHPDDRERITSQHGLQARWFIRRTATPDLSTQIANAEERVREAESSLRSAQYRLDWECDELEKLRTAQTAASEGSDRQ